MEKIMKIKQSFLPLVISIATLKSIVSLIIFFFIVLNNFSDILGFFLIPIVLFSAIFLSCIGAVFKYFRTYYILGEDYIEIRSGLLNLKKETILFSKVTTINSNRSITSQMFNAHEVRFETNDTDNKFEVLIVDEVSYQKIIKAKETYDGVNKCAEEEEVSSKDETLIIKKITNSGLLKFSITNSNVIVSALILFGALTSFSEYFKTDYIDEVINVVLGLEIVFYLLSLVTIVCLILVFSIVRNFIKYYDFTLEKHQDYYKISYGLINKQNFTLQRRYINGVIIKQTLLARIFGICEISLINAGYGSSGKEDGEDTSYFILSVPLQKAHALLKEMMDEYDEFYSGEPPVFKAYIPKKVVSIIITIIVAILLIKFSPIHDIFIYLALILFIISDIIGLFLQTRFNRLCFKDNKIYCTDLTTTFFMYTYKKYIVNVEAVLKLEFNRGPFQRLYGVGDISINMYSDKEKDATLKLHHYTHKFFKDLREYLIEVNKGL